MSTFLRRCAGLPSCLSVKVSLDSRANRSLQPLLLQDPLVPDPIHRQQQGADLFETAHAAHARDRPGARIPHSNGQHLLGEHVVKHVLVVHVRSRAGVRPGPLHLEKALARETQTERSVRVHMNGRGEEEYPLPLQLGGRLFPRQSVRWGAKGVANSDGTRRRRGRRARRGRKVATSCYGRR
eukprot:1176309-Prorocentrum_minimum.AAC.1